MRRHRGRWSRRNRLVALICACLTLAAIPATVMAAELVSGETLIISEPVEGDLYLLGSDILVDAPVAGDIIAAGARIQINKAVTGSVTLAAADITVRGSVGGSIMAAGANVTVSGNVGHALRAAASEVRITGAEITGDAVLAASIVHVDAGAAVRGELLLRTDQTAVDGLIVGGIRGRANTLRVGGTITGTIDVRVNTLRFVPGAVVTESIVYTSDHEMLVDGGTTLPEDVTRHTPSRPTTGQIIANSLLFALFRFAWALALGLLLLRLLPDVVNGVSETLRLAPARSMLWGLTILFGVPLAILIIAVTVIGIPVALLLLGTYIFALYASQIVVGLVIGRAIGANAWGALPAASANRRALALGLLLLAFVRSLPLPNWYGVVSFVTAALALGAIAIYFFRHRPDGGSPASV
jgi:hypothetical protein